MNLLTLIQDASDLIGLARPSSAISSTETAVRQLIGHANQAGKALSKRTDWQALVTEATHTTLAAELQGTLESIAPGFRSWVNETSWNRSQQERVGGPLTPIDWQLLQASPSTGPYQDFRIRGKNLHLFPAPPVGETIAFEYVSRYWCESAAGVGQNRWAADEDVAVLDEQLILLGTEWRFKKAKGLDYAEEFNDYERQVDDAIKKDGAARVLSMNEGQFMERPTIRAPIGSWTP